MPAEAILQQPFSNLQLELLSLYQRNVSDEELEEIRDFLALFFAQRAVKKANEVWDKKQLSEAKILGEHRRTSYQKQSE